LKEIVSSILNHLSSRLQ